MADDDKMDLTPAAVRRMIEQAADKATNKLARNLGYEDAEDMVVQLGRTKGGDDRRSARDNDRAREPRESDAERRLREREEADAKAAADKKRAEDEAAAKKRADDDAAARAAELKKLQDEHQAALEAERTRARMERQLLAQGVNEDDLDYVLQRHQNAVAALPEATRAKGLDLKTFLADLGKAKPHVFAEGRVPVLEDAAADDGKGGKDGKKADDGKDGDAGAGTTLSTGTGTSAGNNGGKKDAGKPVDMSRASPQEVQAWLREQGYTS